MSSLLNLDLLMLPVEKLVINHPVGGIEILHSKACKTKWAESANTDRSLRHFGPTLLVRKNCGDSNSIGIFLFGTQSFGPLQHIRGDKNLFPRDLKLKTQTRILIRVKLGPQEVFLGLGIPVDRNTTMFLCL
jgi:hypothetical protein